MSQPLGSAWTDAVAQEHLDRLDEPAASSRWNRILSPGSHYSPAAPGRSADLRAEPQVLANRSHPIRKAAGLTKWPKNGLRHSFASYHLAQYQDAARLALDMGHSTTKMIFSNYREIVTPEEAERYWNIFPPARAENVLSMAQAS